MACKGKQHRYYPILFGVVASLVVATLVWRATTSYVILDSIASMGSVEYGNKRGVAWSWRFPVAVTMSRARLSARQQRELSHWPTLRHLYLEKGPYTVGEIAPLLVHSSLESLAVEWDDRQNLLKLPRSCQSIKSYYHKANAFSLTDAQWVTTATKVEYLAIVGAQIDRRAMSTLVDASDLHTLSIHSGTWVGGEAICATDFPKVKILALDSCQISPSVLGQILCCWESLEGLYIRNMSLVGESSSGLGCGPSPSVSPIRVCVDDPTRERYPEMIMWISSCARVHMSPPTTNTNSVTEELPRSANVHEE